MVVIQIPDHIMLRLVKVKVKVRTLDIAPLRETPRAGCVVVRIDPLSWPDVVQGN